MSGSLKMKRKHNERLGRVQKVHSVTCTEVGFRGKEERKVLGLQ